MTLVVIQPSCCTVLQVMSMNLFRASVYIHGYTIMKDLFSLLHVHVDRAAFIMWFGTCKV